MKISILILLALTTVGLRLVFASCEEDLSVGDQVIAKGYVSFDGCEYDKTYVVGSYVFRCGSYHYHYHYGEVALFDSGILCVDGEAYLGTIHAKDGRVFPDPQEKLRRLLERLPPEQREQLKKQHRIK